MQDGKYRLRFILEDGTEGCALLCDSASEVRHNMIASSASVGSGVWMVDQLLFHIQAGDRVTLNDLRYVRRHARYSDLLAALGGGGGVDPYAFAGELPLFAGGNGLLGSSNSQPSAAARRPASAEASSFSRSHGHSGRNNSIIIAEKQGRAYGTKGVTLRFDDAARKRKLVRVEAKVAGVGIGSFNVKDYEAEGLDPVALGALLVDTYVTAVGPSFVAQRGLNFPDSCGFTVRCMRAALTASSSSLTSIEALCTRMVSLTHHTLRSNVRACLVACYTLLARRRRTWAR